MPPIITDIIIIVVALGCGGYLAVSRRLARSDSWQATVTPLASIMGSGFLISAPLLGGVVGNLAVLFMAALLLLAFGVGGAIRFNIRHFEPIENSDAAGHHGPAQVLGLASRVVLTGAYFISVTYYLQLLAAFVGEAAGITDPTLTNGLTTALLLLIAGVGMWRGLGMLERVEKYAVALNLGMVAALLVALILYNLGLWSQGEWALPAIASDVSGHDIRVLLGLLIVVQGFETSRYLGDEHSPELRIKTMARAQRLSSLIYLIFIGSLTVLFHDDMGADVTAIVTMTAPVAVVLPMLLSVAAIGSQFSAAVADTAGAGGLVEDLSRGKLPIRYVYALILAATVVLTWETNVNAIIAYASRAFALYYALQCAVALVVARGLSADTPGRAGLKQQLLFAGLTIVCLMVFLLGVPAE